MAKYSYPYACGHGNGIVNLIGKTADRERKLAWYADNFVCPDCYKKQKEEEDATAEKTASLHVAVLDKVWFAVQVHGQIQANKDALRKLGYRWEDEIDGGLLAILKMPKLALQKRMVAASIEQMAETAKQWRQELDGLGYKVTKGISHFDFNAARLHFEYQAKKAAEAEKQKREAAEAEAKKQETIKRLDPKPKPPAWYVGVREGKQYWNGKFYGDKKRGWRVYLDNKEHKIAAEDKDAYEKWRQELEEWQFFWKD